MKTELIILKLEEQVKTIQNIVFRKFTEYIQSFNTFIKKLFNQFILNQFALNRSQYEQILRNTKNICSSKLEVIKTIRHDYTTRTLCILKDGRLASGGRDIVVYDKHTFHPDIVIHELDYSWSICGLKNGNLAVAHNQGIINILEIDGKKHKKVHTLKAYDSSMLCKVIELNDGKLCSFSFQEVQIWDNQKGYKCIQAFKGYSSFNKAILELKFHIVSITRDNNLKVLDKSTYQCIQTIKDIYCNNSNSIAKLQDNKIITGDDKKIFIVDLLSSESKSLENKQFGCVDSIIVLKNGKVLIGGGGRIFFFDLSSNQIFFNQVVHKNIITSLIQNEDGQLFSSSYDNTINVYY